MRLTSPRPPSSLFSYLTSPPPTELYTLSLHDALPISRSRPRTTESCELSVASPDGALDSAPRPVAFSHRQTMGECDRSRSEEHTSELQSLTNLVCRLLLEKKKKKDQDNQHNR